MSADTIQQVKQLAQQYRAVIDLAAKLEGIVSIEQAIAETQLALDKIASDRAAAVADLGHVNDVLAESNERLAGIEAQIVERMAMSDNILNEAAAQAEARGREIFEKAREEEQQLLGLVADHRQDLETLATQITAKSDELAAVTNRIAEAKAALINSLSD